RADRRRSGLARGLAAPREHLRAAAAPRPRGGRRRHLHRTLEAWAADHDVRRRPLRARLRLRRRRRRGGRRRARRELDRRLQHRYRCRHERERPRARADRAAGRCSGRHACAATARRGAEGLRRAEQSRARGPLAPGPRGPGGSGRRLAAARPLAPADAIVAISGDASGARVETAIAPWTAHYAPIRVFSGASSDPESAPSAELMKREAVRAGGPADAVIVEGASTTTGENATRVAGL